MEQLVQPLKKRKGYTAFQPSTTTPTTSPWWKLFSTNRSGRSLYVFFPRSTWKISWVVIAAVMLAGCALPCTYRGKAVPKQDAERMRNLGMDVVCP